ncbi:EAL domain-containing protein [Sporosarcina sp. FSL K6-3457]|uniref:EAL domain-containing protein n=1 Tax=Sporosarcina sp. FSL K6-3457 TaxID=2978204 RepID=UPI0030F85779
MYKNESESISAHTLLSFEHQLSSVEDTLEQLRQSLLVLNKYSSSTDEIATLIRVQQESFPVNGHIVYGLENGDYFQGLAEKIPNSFSPVEQEWYQLALENPNKVFWTEPYLNFFTQEIIITASKPVISLEGIQGVVAIDLNLVEMSNQISNAKIGEDGMVMLMSRNGTMLANREHYMIGESPFGSQFESILEDAKGNYIPYTIQGKDYILRSDTIEQNGMTIVAAISEKEIAQNIFKGQLSVVMIGLLCLLLFGSITYLVVLRGVRPLKKLGTLMASVENGNYDVHAKANDYTEIARLSTGFNSMIQAIKKRDQELLISNQELIIAEEKLLGKYVELQESQKILQAREDKIEHLASRDSLTGLLNRRSLQETLAASLNHEQNEYFKAVIFLDLDNFKMVNDSLGHTFGDKLIIEVAKKLTSLSPIHKEVARISGDEFIVVLHDIMSIEQAKSIAEEIISLFGSPIPVESKLLNMTASVGVALYPLHGETAEELLKTADMAMYRAKSLGKNRYRLFDESIQLEVEEKLKIELGIHESLKNNEFELFFQPLYNTIEGKSTSVEALLRTNSVALSAYNTFQIIQTAEMTGQIVEIDKWVLKEACHAIQKMNSMMKQPVHIAVNISAIHIMQPDFVTGIKKIIKESGVSPEWIELEITETSMMNSFDTNKLKLEELRDMGISIHLDDFGTGYSSLSYLNSLPINHVKIDKSFVDEMLQSEKDHKFIQNIIKLAHTIGLRVVAEGVESKEQFEVLEHFNCELIQGYYISKPLNFEGVIDFLQQ